MVIFRLFGFLLIAAALVALGADVLHSLQSGHIEIRSLSEAWALLHQSSLDGFNAWVVSKAPSIAETVAMIMSYPAWAVLGVIGIVIAGLLALIGRD